MKVSEGEASKGNSQKEAEAVKQNNNKSGKNATYQKVINTL